MAKLSHIDLNVSDYAKSIRFYDMILLPLGWKRLGCRESWTSYSDGVMKICLSPTEAKYVEHGFHRKKTGLNNIAFYAQSKKEVDDFYSQILLKNKIEVLYEKKPDGDDDYYAVFFEDPDRMKLEVVYSPNYCKLDHWTNTFEDNFNPYEKSE